MRRLFWMIVGALLAGYLIKRGPELIRTKLPAGVTGGVRKIVDGLGEEVHGFVEAVKEGMAEREAELRDALGDVESHA